MWELDHKEGWASKNWCFWAVVLEKTLEYPLDSQELKLVNPKGNQSWNNNWKGWSWNSNTLPTGCEKLTFWKGPWCRERLKIGGEGGRQKIKWLYGTIDLMDMSLSKLWELVMVREASHAALHGVMKSQTQLSGWTELNTYRSLCLL